MNALITQPPYAMDRRYVVNNTLELDKGDETKWKKYIKNVYMVVSRENKYYGLYKNYSENNMTIPN